MSYSRSCGGRSADVNLKDSGSFGSRFSQFRSKKFVRVLANDGLVGSMGVSAHRVTMPRSNFSRFFCRTMSSIRDAGLPSKNFGSRSSLDRTRRPPTTPPPRPRQAHTHRVRDDHDASEHAGGPNGRVNETSAAPHVAQSNTPVRRFQPNISISWRCRTAPLHIFDNISTALAKWGQRQSRPAHPRRVVAGQRSCRMLAHSRSSGRCSARRSRSAISITSSIEWLESPSARARSAAKPLL